MAETSQYTFELREAIVALIKEQGIHVGKWTLSFEIGFAAGLFGPTPADLRPGTASVIQRILLTRPQEPLPPPHLIVDAEEVNPAASDLVRSRKRAAKSAKGQGKPV